ncbi:trehalose-phosphatase [Cellulomonas bogoriensis]|uniref:Trehalose 6-phosphate phosphatase n=1 Tax=Cellulomonas bogoriensis 69B4 = DSM 16987 TaxID=1386082 RepID=A0A0A0BSB9_9CELL|nr:trehalose-phosphatase [Cellulomonas bogoriensis]KGM10800.1 haloacid dehalogenase [Cellulomonas bogoriensis 69B4 = DSM 16987]
MSGAAPDQALAEALDALGATVRTGGTVLVALDFDGVLSPLQDDPTACRIHEGSRTALERLGAVPTVQVALVSGRSLADLDSRAEVPDGTFLVGSHGAEHGHRVDGALARDALVVPPEASGLLDALRTALAAAVSGTTARLEHKPTSVVLHTRGSDPTEARRLTDHALGLGARDGVDAMRGKDVVELSVLKVTKGDALALLRERVGAQGLLYAGDDVTDERAFATLGPEDVTVKVGPGATAARFRVQDPDAVAVLLAHLADATS